MFRNMSAGLANHKDDALEGIKCTRREHALAACCVTKTHKLSIDTKSKVSARAREYSELSQIFG